jgi:hypothetical protein
MLKDAGAINPRKLLVERLNEFEDPKITELGLSLLNEMSEGKTDNAEALTKKFYGEYYDN